VKWTNPKIKLEAFRLLNRRQVRIKLRRISPPYTARCAYDHEEGKKFPNALAIFVDPYQEGIVPQVIHELLHNLLDKHLEEHFTYEVLETFLTSLERSFYKSLSRREERKWRKAIEKKLAKSFKLRRLTADELEG
jgi:hypothetical protein